MKKELSKIEIDTLRDEFLVELHREMARLNAEIRDCMTWWHYQISAPVGRIEPFFDCITNDNMFDPPEDYLYVLIDGVRVKMHTIESVLEPEEGDVSIDELSPQYLADFRAKLGRMAIDLRDTVAARKPHFERILESHGLGERTLYSPGYNGLFNLHRPAVVHIEIDDVLVHQLNSRAIRLATGEYERLPRDTAKQLTAVIDLDSDTLESRDFCEFPSGEELCDSLSDVAERNNVLR